MNYIIAEIQKDHTLFVIHQNVPEEEIVNMVSDMDYADRNLIAIPARPIIVKSFNYGCNIEVTLK